MERQQSAAKRKLIFGCLSSFSACSEVIYSAHPGGFILCQARQRTEPRKRLTCHHGPVPPPFRVRCARCRFSGHLDGMSLYRRSGSASLPRPLRGLIEESPPCSPAPRGYVLFESPQPLPPRSPRVSAGTPIPYKPMGAWLDKARRGPSGTTVRPYGTRMCRMEAPDWSP